MCTLAACDIGGSFDDPTNKGFKIWHSVIAQGETLSSPANPVDFRKSFFIKRKKGMIGFDFGDSGRTVYFAVRIEENGKKSTWESFLSASIP
jgi:hypothetical protein